MVGLFYGGMLRADFREALLEYWPDWKSNLILVSVLEVQDYWQVVSLGSRWLDSGKAVNVKIVLDLFFFMGCVQAL